MKNLLFVAAILTVAFSSEGAEMQHLGDTTVSCAVHRRAADRRLLTTASINGIVAGVFLLGMTGFVAMRLVRRYRIQATNILNFPHAPGMMAENTLGILVANAPLQQSKDDGINHFTLSQNTTVEVPSDIGANLWPGGERMLPSPSTETVHNSKDSVLVVEDNSDMRAYIAAILQDRNYTVFSASNGEEAIKLTLDHVPSLVLSDLMMPKMDGLEMTRHLKQDERTSHVPVILLTAKNEVESKLEGLKTGADDYLTKPFLPEELLVRIGNLIEQRKRLHGKLRERILVNPAPGTEMSLDSRFLNKALTVVESNLSDCTFSVEKMADQMNLSRTQLLRKLKGLIRLSPNDFIKDIRLKRAADMIQRKTDTMTQIGFAVGFNDQSYFTKCFKKQFGMTPSEFSANAAGRE